MWCYLPTAPYPYPPAPVVRRKPSPRLGWQMLSEKDGPHELSRSPRNTHQAPFIPNNPPLNQHVPKSLPSWQVMEKFFVIKELLQAQKLFRLLPMTISHKATQERAEKARRKEHQLVQRNRERDKKAPHIWTSSELGKGLQEVPSRPAKVLGTGVDVEASRDGPDDAILVGYNALVCALVERACGDSHVAPEHTHHQWQP